MDIAAGIVHRTGRVKLPGETDCFGDDAAVFRQTPVTCGFIERSPCNDGRMVEISVYSGSPFGTVIAETAVMVDFPVYAERMIPECQSPVRKFAPGEIPHPIRPVMEAFLKNFLMQTRTVETRFHGEFNILFQIFIRGRSPDSLRVKTLIQHQPEKNRLVVQIETVPFNMTFPQSRIGFYGIQQFSAGVPDFVMHIVQMWLARFPENRRRNFQFDGDAAAARQCGPGADFPVRRDLNIQGVSALQRMKFRDENQHSPVDVRNDPAFLQSLR